MGAYFRSDSKMLSEGGEVHIRHRDDLPYHTWNVVSLAAEAGLKLKEKVLFDKSLYPGYHKKRGGDININKTFPILCAFTFKFALDLPQVNDHYSKNDEEVRVLDVHGDEVCVSEMKDRVHCDEVYVSEVKSQAHDDEAHASEMKDQAHTNLHEVQALEVKDPSNHH